MKAKIAMLGFVALLSGGRRAAADPAVRFRAGLDFGYLTSLSDGARRDEAEFVNLVPAAVFHPASRWELSIGATIPAAPILDLQLPVSLGYAPVRHLVLRGALRPSFAAIDLCASGPGACPEDQAAPATDRGGWAAGAFVEVGAGYRFYFGNPWSEERPPFELDLRVGYLGGGWFARGGKNEKPLGGYWQGFVLGADMTF